MKALLLALIACTFSLASHAGDIASAGNYVGAIQGVAVGFWGHVGVGLPAGQTCHGSNVVVLLTSNAKFKEILSVMLAAEMAKQPVSLYMLGLQTSTFAEIYTYCVITEASLGTFPGW